METKAGGSSAHLPVPPICDPLALSRLRPSLSARVPLTGLQKVLLALGSAIVLGIALNDPLATARLFVLVTTIFYVIFSLHKFLLARLSASRLSEIVVTPEELAGPREADLPVYSILVPMYHEPESVRQMVEALAALDYPANKKEVQFLVEADDLVTRGAFATIRLPPGFRVTLVPVSVPRTKPKACNLGLANATGQYLVIYDAEDRPEPDQLRKAVAAFRKVGPEVICLQSKLNFYNPRQNLLTRWFAAEYSAWFDLALPGLSALQTVIPLGGTSNHFVTARLKELLGWDAYNVAEDCDLGVRIYRAGYRSRMLDTTTWEEACSSLPYWIRQRTRWLKGYIQTYFVHMRNPFRLLCELGVLNFFHFQMLVGGIVFSFLINPLFWLLAVLWFVLRLEIFTALFPPPIFAAGALCLFLGNFVFVYLGAIASYRRGYYDLVKYTLLVPPYWFMMSYSGWRAFFQFFADPFRWEKTKHGLFEHT